jgi:hypothetical protein
VLWRTYGQHRSATVGLRDAWYIMSQRRTTGADAEVEAIRAITGGDPTAITSLDVLLDRLVSGRAGALRFACHHTADRTGLRIDLDGDAFVPELSAAAEATQQLAATRTLVFLSACRSASTLASFIQTLGWAQRFMAAGPVRSSAHCGMFAPTAPPPMLPPSTSC